MKRRTLTAVTVAAILAAGCSSGSNPASSVQPSNDAPEGAASAPPTTKNHAWAQAATVIGENGGQIKVSPVGVLYHKGPYTSGLDGPENGWFVAVALRAEAVSKQDQFLAPAAGGGFRWRGQNQTLWGGEGNAATTPWIGAVPAFGDPIEPGSPEMGIETFDVPVKGGRLLYINADQSIVSWDLPTTDTGTGLDKVRARIKEFS